MLISGSIIGGSFSPARPADIYGDILDLIQVLKLGTVEMTETWRQGDSTCVRLVTRPDFANWVPKGVQGQANAKAIEFHDVSGGVQGLFCHAMVKQIFGIHLATYRILVTGKNWAATLALERPLSGKLAMCAESVVCYQSG